MITYNTEDEDYFIVLKNYRNKGYYIYDLTYHANTRRVTLTEHLTPFKCVYIRPV